jgi:hypothetical protein
MLEYFRQRLQERFGFFVSVQERCYDVVLLMILHDVLQTAHNWHCVIIENQLSATFVRNNTQPVLLVFYRKLQFHFLSS